jgi:tetrahydromethanopterin S-methyltransferase subunit G
LGLPQIEAKIAEFNKFNKTSLSTDDVIEAIKRWLAGMVYKDIAKHVGADIDVILKLFASLIGFEIQSVLSSIVRIVDNKLLEHDKQLSEIILDWPQYLLYGLNSRLQLDLVELGFTNRIGIIALSKLIQTSGFKYDDIKKLKNHVIKNREDLLDKLIVPQIVYDKMNENMDYLSRKNIY